VKPSIINEMVRSFMATYIYIIASFGRIVIKFAHTFLPFQMLGWSILQINYYTWAAAPGEAGAHSTALSAFLLISAQRQSVLPFGKKAGTIF
jgi:hypothetical protein